MDCLFCKIIHGEIPSNCVYEDEKTLAFLDIAPSNYGHTLVIPKEHYKNIDDVPEEILFAVVRTVKKIGVSIKTSMKVEGYNVMVNNGSVAGQIVPHLHFHIVPRNKKDEFEIWPQGRYGEGEIGKVAEKIKKEIK